jgi:predicted RNase H-like nuclease
MLILGVDLAWGDKKPDGICIIDARSRRSTIVDFAYPRGDPELLACVKRYLADKAGAFVTIDAPIVCPNRSGTRPVDRLTHRLFHPEHAACHPANSTKCPRPPRVLRKLRRLGFAAGWEVHPEERTVAEVYPHPAMVRMFRLPRIVKYKKGPVAHRRSEFQRLQRLIRSCLSDLFPSLRLTTDAKSLLEEPWSKPVEDKTDALFCALIGLWHWQHRGERSEVIGNLRTGFILLPHDLRPSPKDAHLRSLLSQSARGAATERCN